MLKHFYTFIQGSRGRVAAAVVIAYALTLGVFIARTFVEPLPGQYQPDFGTASWIQLQHPDEAAYFRKTLYIPGAVEQASIVLAATGNFTLFVNDVTVDQSSFAGARVSGVYDLKTLLVSGKNVIAVHVDGGTFPTPPQIRARGSYRLKSGLSREFISDSSWKASETPDGVIGNYGWAATGLEDANWSNAATALDDERFSTLQPLTSDPALYSQPLVGHWIETPTMAANQASFAYDVLIPDATRQVWMQLAASGGYDLFINGRLAAMVAGNDQAAVFGPESTVPLSGQVTRTSQEMPHIIGPLNGLAGSEDLAVLEPQIPRPVAPDQEPPSAPASAVLAPNLPPPNPGLNEAGRPQQITSGAANSIATGFSFASPSPTPTPAGPPQRQVLSSPPRSRGAAEEGPRATPVPAITNLIQPVPITGVTAAGDEAVAPPDLNDIAEPVAPLAPQPFPLSPLIGAEPAAPAMIAYDLTNYFHPGRNRILIRVESTNAPPAVLVDGQINLGGGEARRFGSDRTWSMVADAAGGEPSPQRQAVAMGAFNGAPSQLIPQVAAAPSLLPGEDVRIIVRWSATLATTLIAVVLLWAAAASVFASDWAQTEDLWGFDALLHLPMLLGLIGLWLSTFDVRFPYDWCFSPVLVVAFLVLLPASKLLLLAKRRPAEFVPSALPPRSSTTSEWLPIGALAVIVIAGLIVRAWGMLDPSMSHDEVSVVRMAQGIFKIGFPFMRTGSFVRYAATYEMLPYPIALSWLLFGGSVFALRLPALIFGTLTIGLIGWVGRRLMDWRVGLTAAIVYAFLPATILHSQDLFYPAQESFFALASIWLFYEAIREPGINHRAMTWATAAFICAYLSWEGSGFFLPAMFVAIVACKWGEWDWLLDGHLWLCVAIAAAVVILELSWKMVAVIPDYLGVGKDLNELASPTLAFLDRLVFDAFFYVRNFFFIDNQALLTIVAIAGLVVVRRHQAILYLNALLISVAILYTGFLGLYHPKYAYNWTPILVLAAAGTAFYIYDRVGELCIPDRRARLVRGLAGVLGGVILIGYTNPYLVKLYRFAAVPQTPTFDSRFGVSFSPDYRDEDNFVARHLLPGDAVVTPTPHVFQYDTGIRPDYTMNTMLAYRYYFDRGQASPGFIDRSLGVPLIFSLDDLRRAQAQYRRLWIIERNIKIDAETPDITAYLLTHGRVVYESDLQSVVLLDGVGAIEAAASQPPSREPSTTRE